MDRKHSEEWQSRVSRTVNSTVCFSLAYVILTYLLWFVPGLTGLAYKFDSFVYYYGIKFILNGHGWTKLTAASLYASGSVCILALALTAIFLFSRLKEIRSIANLFFLWVFIVGISIFISQVIMAGIGMYHYNSIYYQGLAVSFAWLRIPASVVYTMDVLVIMLLVYIGVNSARPFLIFSFSFSKVNNLERRRRYFFETALVPYILGSLVTIVAIFPKELSAKNVWLLLASTHAIYIAVMGMILGTGWLSLSYVEISKQHLARYKTLQEPNVVTFIIMVIAWAFIYITFMGIYLAH